MIGPLQREQIIDLRAEPLGAGWLRRFPTREERREVATPGVWRTGPEGTFRRAMVQALDGAREIALLSSFLLSDELLAKAMQRAADRRVRVYVLTASEQRIGKELRDHEDFGKRMAAEHKQLLDSLAGRVLLRSAEHIHAKFLVVDPQLGSGARAWLSTANFNKALEDNFELGVLLEGGDAQALASCFQWAFWCEAERELRGQRLAGIAPQPPATPARPDGATVFATLRDGARLRERVMAMIQSAERELLVASYGLGADHPSVRELIAAARRGVQVTVLTRPRPAVAEGVMALAAAGARVVAHDKLHAKALAVDGQVLVMSANLEAHGLDQGFEVGATLTGEAARGVAETLREWAATFPWGYRADATRGEHLGDFCPVRGGLRGEIAKVVAHQTQQLATVTAADALALEDAPAPVLKVAPTRGEFPQRVTCTWSVVAPSLPKGATERLREIEPEAAGGDGQRTKTIAKVSYEPRRFEHAGKIYVRLERGADAELVRQAAAELDATVVL